jgi:hypothetical protein
MLFNIPEIKNETNYIFVPIHNRTKKLIKVDSDIFWPCTGIDLDYTGRTYFVEFNGVADTNIDPDQWGFVKLRRAIFRA